MSPLLGAIVCVLAGVCAFCTVAVVLDGLRRDVAFRAREHRGYEARSQL
jgi:hypothetical protein